MKISSPPDRHDFDVWRARRWHGGRAPYWHYDERLGRLTVLVNGRNGEQRDQLNLRYDASVLFAYRLGWRALVAQGLVLARQQLRRTPGPLRRYVRVDAAARRAS
jgi:hypothetical protein